jgi:hypothetical protein
LIPWIIRFVLRRRFTLWDIGIFAALWHSNGGWAAYVWAFVAFCVGTSLEDRLLPRSSDTWATNQAKADQKLATYPGCRTGSMSCLDQTCGCAGATPSAQFVKARAAQLAERFGEDGRGIKEKYL